MFKPTGTPQPQKRYKGVRNALLRLANTPKGSTAYDRAISTVTQSLTRVAQASQKEAQ